MTKEPKPVMIDDAGAKWWNWLYCYDWDGKTYSFAICARSKEEADARLKRLPLARYDGQQDGESRSQLAGGLLVPLIVWWRNLRRAA